jgi:hypothetical protein
VKTRLDAIGEFLKMADDQAQLDALRLLFRMLLRLRF